MRQRLFLLGVMTVAATLCCITPQLEASILSTIVQKGSPYPTGIVNQIEDIDAEKIFKGEGNTDFTRFEVGDTLELHLDFVSITSGNGAYFGSDLDSILPAYPNYQFAGIGVFEITAIDNISGGLGDFSFDGSIDFYEVGDSIAAGKEIDFTDGFSTTQTKINTTTKIMSAAKVDSDDFIVAYNAPIAFADIPTLEDGTSVEAKFGLTVTMNDLGIISDAMKSTASTEDGQTETWHDITGFNNSYATPGIPNTANPDTYDLATNTTINFQATVPEPASMLVWAGLAGLIGLVSLRRRK